MLWFCSLLPCWQCPLLPNPLRGLTESGKFFPATAQTSITSGHFTLTLRKTATTVTIIQTWRARLTVTDSITLTPDGGEIDIPVESWVVPTNVYMGIRMPEGGKRLVSARYENKGKTLFLRDRFTLSSSQGTTPVTVEHRYSLTDEKDILTYTIKRSSRKSGPEVKYTFKRKGSRQAYAIRLNNDFTIPGGLPVNAMMISLQGLANKNGPLVYLLYPDDWPFTYVNPVFDFYKEKRFYTFTELKTPADAVKTLARFANGYVVWDTSVRTSLIVAYTVAGLEEAVVVSEAEIPLVQAAGLKPVEDLRGTFKGMNDIQIYSWAHQRYWARCSREYIIWLGGEHGTMMKPAVADWGIMKGVFFNDLSTRTTDSAEYALADRLLSEMKPMSMVMGWHSYKKDLEEEHVTLTSRYGHRVEGLNSLPNLSFSSQIPTSPGFVFKNNHHVKPGEKIVPEREGVCHMHSDRRDGAWCMGEARPGRDTLRLGVSDELHLDRAGHGGIFLLHRHTE